MPLGQTLLLSIALLLSAGFVNAAAVDEGRQIFNNQCAPCHTIGGGKLVGPDLAGVTSRRDTGWLQRQIKEPDQLIAEEDPIAMQLLEESNNVPMAPLGLNDAQVAAVIEYLKSTEQASNVETSLPAQYVPTLIVSIVILALLTVIGLRAGQKTVEVR